MATRAEVEFWKDQCRTLTAALERSREDKHALTARIFDNSEEAKTARAIADGLQWQVDELTAENARLRELCKRLIDHIDHPPCDGCSFECDGTDLTRCDEWSRIEADARELGIRPREALRDLLNIDPMKAVERTCHDCKHAEIHGFPPEGAPEWMVFTVSLWCPLKKAHSTTACDLYEYGEPRIVRDDVDDF